MILIKFLKKGKHKKLKLAVNVDELMLALDELNEFDWFGKCKKGN